MCFINASFFSPYSPQAQVLANPSKSLSFSKGVPLFRDESINLRFIDSCSNFSNGVGLPGPVNSPTC